MEEKMMSLIETQVAPIGMMNELRYVVTFSRYHGQWIFSKHRERTTWETQGGHIEPGETPLEAAKRELTEESGATQFEIFEVCDYCSGGTSGRVYLALVEEIGSLPESEMEKIGFFDELPTNWTYPDITPHLIAEVKKHPKFQ